MIHKLTTARWLCLASVDLLTGLIDLMFYLNLSKCRPDDLLIDELHERWQGRYDLLERKHGFIQWLFPIREHGMNWESQPLQLHELETMKGNSDICTRMLTSYRLMLDFYGMELVDEKTGELSRRDGDWQARYHNLATSSHNNLRISRILKCLGEMELGKYPAAFVLFVLAEQSEHGVLADRAIVSSMDGWVRIDHLPLFQRS